MRPPRPRTLSVVGAPGARPRDEPTSARPTVGIVGGGLLGTVLALRLAQAGADVTLLERGASLGGLAAAMDFGAHRVDRFHQVVVPSDERMLALAREVGLGDAVSFVPAGVGIWSRGQMMPLNDAGDLTRFALLSPLGRARLAWFVLQCRLRPDWVPLEDRALLPWLRLHCGRQVVDRVWRPLLDSRFDGAHDELPATYLWARTNRLRSARTSRGQGRTMGCIGGGHQALIDALQARAMEQGVDVRVGADVGGLVLDADGAVVGVRVDGVDEGFDLTIPTLQPPALRPLLPAPLAPLLDAYPERYLGVVCLVLKVRRSLLPYYSVDICEPTPFTTAVETSHVVGTEHTDGLRLVYVSKYGETSAPELREDDAGIYGRFTAKLSHVAPRFRHEDVVEWTVQRAPFVEPVHTRRAKSRIAPVWPGVDGLALASASQIYPWSPDGDSVVRMAEQTAAEAAERLGLDRDAGARPALAGVA